MKPSLNSYNPSANNNLGRYITFAILVLALLGLADATYLTVTHYTGEEVACSVVKGCEQVLTSKYATIYGVPVAALGIAYYATLFLLMYYYRLSSNKLVLRLFQLTISAGVLATTVLVYLQLQVIHYICQYCMISAGLTTIIAILAVVLWIKNKSYENNQIVK